MAAGTYDASDIALARPVDVRELDELLWAKVKPVLRDPGRLTHLLTRVRSTIGEMQHDKLALQRRIEELSMRQSQVGRPTTLDPLDAVKFLDDDQKDLLYDRHTRQHMAALRALVQQAEQERAALQAQIATVRQVATALIEQPDLPEHVRTTTARLLAQTPDAPVTVHHPAVLDFPEPAPRAKSRPGGVDTGRVQPSAGVAPQAVSPDPASEVAYVDPWAPTGAVFVDPYAPRVAPEHEGERP